MSRSEAGGSDWELAIREPRGPAGCDLAALQGYAERSPRPVRRREFASAHVVVILELEPALRVRVGGAGDERRHDSGFVAGLGDTFLETSHAGRQAGIELRLSPLAARRCFGIPLSELAGRVVSLRDLLPKQDGSLCERLAEQPGWDDRFDLVERVIGQRLAAARFRASRVEIALDRIERSGGRVDVAALARELGCSGKHLITLFHDAIGVGPKQLCRIVRFERLSRRLRAPALPSLAALAPALGFYDQSHLAREVVRFTGLTPAGYHAALAGQPLVDGEAEERR